MVRYKVSAGHESGNILIYILGAIFLLGILVVMLRGSGSSTSNIDEEQLMLRLNEIQEYGRDLEQAVAYILANGHTEADIRFSHPDADPAYGDITDTPTRQIFDKAGGGASYRLPPNGIQVTTGRWIYSGQNNVPEVGSDNSELLAILPNVTEEFCLRINERNHIENTSGVPPQDTGAFEINTPFDGTFNNGQEIGDIGFNANKSEGCVEGSGTPPIGTYYYYRVLMVR